MKRMLVMVSLLAFSLAPSAVAFDIPVDLVVTLVVAADANQDGYISYEEVSASIPMINLSMFNMADADGDGSISLKDVAITPLLDQTEVYAAAVTVFDTNLDGKVTYEEAKAIFPGLPQDHFAILDKDGNGYLSTEDAEGPIVLPPDPLAGFPPNLVAFAEGLIAWLDTNSDGLVQYSEITSGIPVLGSLISYDDIDINGDGGFNLDDLEGVDPSVLDEVSGYWPVALNLLDGNDDSGLSLSELRMFVVLPETVFAALDANGDGKITVDEITGEGSEPPVDPPATVLPEGIAELWTMLLGVVDADSDGLVSLSEIQAIVPSLGEDDIAFADLSGDGKIGADDLAGWLDNYPVNLDLIISLMLGEVDNDNDGGVSLVEAQAQLPNLTQEQFGLLDTNGDGVFNKVDVVGEGPVEPPVLDGVIEFVVGALLQVADKDGDDAISLTEAQAIVGSISENDFDSADINHDGVLNRADVAAWLQIYPLDGYSLLMLGISQVDSNGDGGISLEEAQAQLSSITPALFDRFDANKDGLITIEDALGIQPPSLDDLDLIWEQLIGFVDADGDLALSRAEAEAYLAQGTAGVLFGFADTDSDGLITLEEVRNLPIPHDLEELALMLIPLLDADGDGEVTVEEIHVVIPAFSDSFMPLIDMNGDGVISASDFVYTPDLGVLPELWSVLLDYADSDDSGALSVVEIEAVIPISVEDGFGLVDRDMDGEVTLDEILSFIPIPVDKEGIISLLLGQFGLDSITPELISGLIGGTIGEDLIAVLDVNGDGVLNTEDLGVIVTPEGEDPIDPNADCARVWDFILPLIDQNNDDQVSTDEAIVVLTLLQALVSMPTMDLDTNDDGFITFDEVHAATGLCFDDLRDALEDFPIPYSLLSSLLPGITQEMFAKIDLNGDGSFTVADLDGELEEEGEWTPEGEPVLEGEIPVVIPDGCENVWFFVLALLDADGDALISTSEANVAISVATSLIPNQLPNLDRDADGYITFEELYAATGACTDDLESAMNSFGGQIPFNLLSSVIPGFTHDDYSVLDRNGDGVFNVADLDFGNEVEGDAPEFPADIIWQWANFVARWDRNNDGGISCEEVGMPSGWCPVLEYDSDGNGIFTLDDMANFAGSLFPGGEDSGGSALNVIMQADADGDNALTLQEIVSLIPSFTENLFDELDVTGDGVLNYSDLFGGNETDPEGESEAEGEEVEPEMPPLDDPVALTNWLIAQADADGDGKISLAEAQALIPGLPVTLFNRLLDRNDDGFVSIEDLPAQPQPDPIELLKRMIALADQNADGQITFEEAKVLVPALSQHIFAAMDVNGDGALSPADLPQTPEIEIGALLQRLISMLPVVDADHDGAVSFDEAKVVMPFLTQEMFAHVDRNGDGSVSPADLPEGNPDISVPELAQRILAALNADPAAGLSAEAAAELGVNAEIFAMLDKNGDGILTLADFGANHNEDGEDDGDTTWPSLPPTRDPASLLTWLLNVADTDDDHAISLEEARAVVPGLSHELFASLDRNGDGLVSAADLAEVQNPPTDGEDDGDGPLAGPRELLTRLLLKADANNDGVLSMEELTAAIPELTLARFVQMDVNGDGVLSRADLPEFVDEVAQIILSILGEADADANGEVTLQELAAIRPNMTVQQFSRLDRNHDNIISRADLDVPAADRLQRLVLIVAGADANGDGAVTFEELLAKVADLTEAEFGLLDRNGDGELTSADVPKQVRDAREELRSILRRMGSNAKGGFSIDDILARIPELNRIELGQLDVNGDGTLSLEDLPQLPVPRTDRGRGQLLRSILNADWNMDGVIDQSELETVFPDAPAELLALIDANQDWALTRSEIMAILGKDIAGLRELVKPWDVDADGRITATDIQSVVNSALRRHGLSLPADVDGDGRVNAVDIQTVISGLLNN